MNQEPDTTETNTNADANANPKADANPTNANPSGSSGPQDQPLEQEIKILQDWKILKSALKEKYQVHSDAFDALKKPDAEVLTKADFSAYTSVNMQDYLF